MTSAPADWWKSQAALQAAQETYRLNHMTYEQKLNELETKLHQPSLQVPYGPNALLDQARLRPQTADAPMTTPTVLASHPGTSAASPVHATGYTYNESAGKIVGSSSAGSFSPTANPAQSQAIPVSRFSYRQEAPRTDLGSQPSLPAQAPAIPNVSARIPGAQSQTASLRFPGE